MENIKQASTQNVASAKQLETAARNLSDQASAEAMVGELRDLKMKRHTDPNIASGPADMDAVDEEFCASLRATFKVESRGASAGNRKGLLAAGEDGCSRSAAQQAD